MWKIEEIEKLILDVTDFPKKGVVFKDITPILNNHEAFVSLARQFVLNMPEGVEKLVAIESRGFILGAAVAQHLNVGLVLARKPGKLPRETFKHTYELEYGTDTLEIHKDAISAGEKIVIIDDVLATGGTAQATAHLCNSIGVELLGFQFLLEIEALKGREKLPDNCNIHSFIRC